METPVGEKVARVAFKGQRKLSPRVQAKGTFERAKETESKSTSKGCIRKGEGN